MPQTPYILTAVDVRRIADPDSSRLNIINSFQAPAIRNKTIQHTHGGGNGDVKFVLPTFEAFEPTFDTFGPDLDSFAAVGLLTGTTDTWVFAGAYLQRGAPKPVSSRIIIGGTIAEIDEGQSSAAGADKQSTKHAIHGVTHYERWVGGKEWVYWDFYEPSSTRINGVAIMAPTMAALGL